MTALLNDTAIIGELRESLLNPVQPAKFELPDIDTPKAQVLELPAIRPVDVEFHTPAAPQVRRVFISTHGYGHFRHNWGEEEAEIYYRPSESGVLLSYDGTLVDVKLDKPRRLREWVYNMVAALKFGAIMAMFGAAVVMLGC